MDKTYERQICHYLYSESTGEPLMNIVPGTAWDEIGDEFRCPHCQATKKMFIEVRG